MCLVTSSSHSRTNQQIPAVRCAFPIFRYPEKIQYFLSAHRKTKDQIAACGQRRYQCTFKYIVVHSVRCYCIKFWTPLCSVCSCELFIFCSLVNPKNCWRNLSRSLNNLSCSFTIQMFWCSRIAHCHNALMFIDYFKVSVKGHRKGADPWETECELAISRETECELAISQWSSSMKGHRKGADPWETECELAISRETECEWAISQLIRHTHI